MDGDELLQPLDRGVRVVLARCPVRMRDVEVQPALLGEELPQLVRAAGEVAELQAERIVAHDLPLGPLGTEDGGRHVRLARLLGRADLPAGVLLLALIARLAVDRPRALVVLPDFLAGGRRVPAALRAVGTVTHERAEQMGERVRAEQLAQLGHRGLAVPLPLEVELLVAQLLHELLGCLLCPPVDGEAAVAELVVLPEALAGLRQADAVADDVAVEQSRAQRRTGVLGEVRAAVADELRERDPEIVSGLAEAHLALVALGRTVHPGEVETDHHRPLLEAEVRHLRAGRTGEADRHRLVLLAGGVRELHLDDRTLPPQHLAEVGQNLRLEQTQVDPAQLAVAGHALHERFRAPCDVGLAAAGHVVALPYREAQACPRVDDVLLDERPRPVDLPLTLHAGCEAVPFALPHRRDRADSEPAELALRLLAFANRCHGGVDVFLRGALSIVADGHAVGGEVDLDPHLLGVGVQGVLDQLLDHVLERGVAAGHQEQDVPLVVAGPRVVGACHF